MMVSMGNESLWQREGTAARQLYAEVGFCYEKSPQAISWRIIQMDWTFERVFYGSKKELDLKSIWDFLGRGYYFTPRTLFTGYYRAVKRVGDYHGLYRTIEKPFPDMIEAQRPTGKFALHL